MVEVGTKSEIYFRYLLWMQLERFQRQGVHSGWKEVAIFGESFGVDTIGLGDD